MNYYNEFDPKAAAWLRELIRVGAIADGVVDERSILEIKANELEQYNQCHFFAGIGGWSLALRLAGWSDDRPAWTGSCPCQPFSVAGNGLGESDERHLWPTFAALITQRNPTVVFGEQVASKAGRSWLAGVRTDLEGMGYAVGAADLCAASAGAPHVRQRLYWVADALGAGLEGGLSRGPDTQWQAVSGYPRCGSTARPWDNFEPIPCKDGRTRRVEPGTFPLAHGFPDRVGLLRGYGNAIVPQVAATFIESCYRS